MNHYQWLEEHFLPFYQKVCEANNVIPQPDVNEGIITAHGDKCYQYKKEWEAQGIHFFHGAACHLLTYLLPWSSEVREQPNGFVKPAQWVIDNYDKRFRPHLPMINPVKLDYSFKSPIAKRNLLVRLEPLELRPVGNWVTDNGMPAHSIRNVYTFYAKYEGRTIRCTMVEDTYDDHGAIYRAGSYSPRFLDVVTNESVNVKDGDYIELIDTPSQMELDALKESGRRTKRVQWKVLDYPIGQWVDQNGNPSVELDGKRFFKARHNGQEIACTMTFIHTRVGMTPDEPSRQGYIPEFFNVATGAACTIKDGDFIELV